MNTLWRLNTSPYFPSHFRNLEEKLAQKLGLAYHEGKSSPPKLDKNSRLIVVSNTHCQLPNDITQHHERIDLLIHANSGFDNISYDWAQDCDFPIILGNPIRAHGVCNMILSHLFHHTSPLHHQEQWDVSRSYDRKLISEMSILILGYGCIGQLLEKALRPLCKELIIVDPYKFKSGRLNHHDVVIPVPSLNQSSRGLIDQPFLENQSPELLLINCSRGQVINIEHLITFLKENINACAYLDVYEKEPCDFSQIQLHNLKTTSHIAGVFKNLYQETLSFEENVINDFCHSGLDHFNDVYHELILQNRTHKDFL